MTTTFPNFQFTVATKDHFEIWNDPVESEEVNQTLFSKLTKAYLPERLDKKIIEKYLHLKHDIKCFMNSIVDELSLDEDSIVISLVYLERLISKAKIELRASNWKAILLTSIILAVKYTEDWGFWNFDFLEYWKYTIPGINLMESRFIQLIDFDLFVSSDLYARYEKLMNNLYNKTHDFEEKQRKKSAYQKYGFISSRKHRRGLLK